MTERIHERIKRLRKQNNLSVDEIIKKLNVSRATYYRYESNEIEKLPLTILEPLAQILNTTPAYLMGWQENIPAQSNIYPANFKKVPLLGSTAAGSPIYSEGSFDGYINIEDKYNIDFCLRVKGESMIDAGINDGDIVFIHSQPTVENGQIAVVRINGDEVTLKRFYKIQNGVMLQSENPDKVNYAPMIFTENDVDSFSILGLAVLKQSEIK